MTKEFDERNAEKSRAVCERIAEAASTGKRILTDRERRILEMWPRFEDGEYVMPGDKVHYSSAYNDETEIEVESITAMYGYFVLCDDECRSNQYEQWQRVKRPAPKVRDADGVEIKVGDSMYVANNGDGPYIVCDIEESIDMIELFWHRNRNEVLFIPANRLTHTPPDSWERLEEDAVKEPCDYFGVECDEDKGCSGCPHLHEGRDCAIALQADLIRRAKALAGVEAGQ